MAGEQRFAGFSLENELAQRHHDMIPGTAKQNLIAVLPNGTSAKGRTRRGEPAATGKLITAEFRVELSA